MDEEAPSRREQLRTSLRRLGLAIVVVAVAAAMAGYLFARSAPKRAAATRIAGFVIDEPVGAGTETPVDRDPAAPTGGELDAGAVAPVCGVSGEPLTTDQQVASLRAGHVLVQYRRDEVTDDDIGALRTLAGEHPDHLVVAPNSRLAVPVAVTAWSRRMPLERPDRDLITSFLTAYAGEGPDPTPCAAGDAP